MVSVDEHTQVAMEIVSEGTKLSEELILKVLQSLTNLFSKDKDQQNFAIKDNSIEGKQKIKDLVQKHKDGVMPLDDNVSKEQLNDYQKEFKKMGVDFSIVKNDKDSYSFFFASKDANIIEKSLKNIIEKKSKSLENENENSSNNISSREQKEISTAPKEEKKIGLTDKEKKLEDSLNKLSPKEKVLFSKINELEGIKKELSQEQIKNVQSLYNEYSTVEKTDLKKEVLNNNKSKSKNENTVERDTFVSNKNVSNNPTKQNEKEKSPSIYSVKGVKEINTILKEQDKNNDKDKKRNQSLSR